MKKQTNFRNIGIATAVVVAGIGIFVATQLGDDSTSGAGGANLRLSQVALAGKTAYDTNCAQCHGANGAGTDKGPPLVHQIYNPGHHSDASFARAVSQGVPQHHWKFGNMPAQPQVTDAMRDAIVQYVRAVQESNGITYQVHKM